MDDYGKWLFEVSFAEQGFASSSGLLYAAAVHTWIVKIHSFIDGNGRIAHLLMNLLRKVFGKRQQLIILGKKFLKIMFTAVGGGAPHTNLP